MVRYVRLTNTGRLVLDRYRSVVNQYLCRSAANGSTMTAFWPDLPEFFEHTLPFTVFDARGDGTPARSF